MRTFCPVSLRNIVFASVSQFPNAREPSGYPFAMCRSYMSTTKWIGAKTRVPRSLGGLQCLAAKAFSSSFSSSSAWQVLEKSKGAVELLAGDLRTLDRHHSIVTFGGIHTGSLTLPSAFILSIWSAVHFASHVYQKRSTAGGHSVVDERLV